MSDPRIRAVYDCNVLLQAALGTGPASKCLDFLVAGRVELCISKATVDEARDVLSRPKILRKYPRLTTAKISGFFDGLEADATLFSSVPHKVDFPRDRRDEPYLDLAVASQARYLVTRDQMHLLSFAAEQSPEADAFRARFPFLRIIDPVQFIRQIDGAGRPTRG